MRERTDLNWVMVVAGAASTPPEEVSRDPERLSVWQAEQAKKKSASDGIAVFEVQGCDHHEYLGCTNPDARGRRGVNLAEVKCMRHPVGASAASRVAEQLEKKDAALERLAEKQEERAAKREERERKREEREKKRDARAR